MSVIEHAITENAPVAPHEFGLTIAEFLDMADHHRAELRRAEDLAYQWGHIAGFEAGYHQAEQEMAEHWAGLVQGVRALAARLKGPVPQPVMQERPSVPASACFTDDEWADYTGTERA